MILRRIAHAVKQQQWTAVLIELVIVILGVFLGFQVSDWANERANRSAEMRHLEEIAEDLRADAAIFDQIRSSAEMRISGIDYILGETRGVNRPMTSRHTERRCLRHAGRSARRCRGSHEAAEPRQPASLHQG